MQRAQATGVPPETRIGATLPRVDYADAYRVVLPDVLAVDLDHLHSYVLAATPAWARLLMRLRDRLARLAGLKPAGLSPASRHAGPLRAGDALGLFRVVERSDHELILGGDDRHLDLRISILCRQDQSPRSLTVTTAVQFHNRFGRLYFALIGPFHRLIVPAMLTRLGGTAVKR